MTDPTGIFFIDTGFAQCCCQGEKACGDTVAFRRIDAEDRLIAVLADGLGHGIKANILSLMTSTMALRFAAEEREIVQYAEIIMDSLPVCQVRQISYSTFTIVDCRPDGSTRIIEMGNPPFLLFRGGIPQAIKGEEIFSPKYADRTMTVYTFNARLGDRIVFFSDGVSQSGLGSPELPLGWQNDGAEKYISGLLRDQPDISSQELSERVLREAVAHEPGLKPQDDISVSSLYFRPTHRMLLLTGPPYDPERDAEYAGIFRSFRGTKAICGGTTATIISRELNVQLEMDLESMSGDLPPLSNMEGADLVSEGIVTLSRVCSYLADGIIRHDDPAGKLVELLRRSDVIEFIVGTRINEAHQDPNLPVDLELRRNIVGKLAALLHDKYTKEVHVRFI